MMTETMGNKGENGKKSKKDELKRWLAEMTTLAPKNIRNDEILQSWLREVKNRSPRTIKSYMLGISRYVKFTGMSLKALKTEAEEDQRARLMPNETRLLQHLIDFKEYLDYETDMVPNTVYTRISGVKAFYDAFYINVPDIHNLETPQPMAENIKHITVDNVRDVLLACDQLERALVLVGCSSGMAATDICNLKIKDFKEWYDPETGTTAMPLIRSKTKVPFIGCLTPEASDAVWEYLKYRDRQPKRISQERIEQTTKQHVTSDDGYLFVLRKVPQKYLDESIQMTWQEREDLRKIDAENTYPHIFARVAEKCQMYSMEGWSIVRSHNFRKFFSDTLLNNHIDSFFVYRLLAHKQKSSDAPYYTPDVERVRAKYIKECVALLTIQKEYDFTKSPVYKEMQKEKAAMQAEIEKLKQENLEQYQYNTVLEGEVQDALSLREELIAQAVRAELAKIYKDLGDSNERIKKGIEKRGGKMIKLEDLSEEERENMFSGADTEKKDNYPDW